MPTATQRAPDACLMLKRSASKYLSPTTRPDSVMRCTPFLWEQSIRCTLGLSNDGKKKRSWSVGRSFDRTFDGMSNGTSDGNCSPTPRMLDGTCDQTFDGRWNIRWNVRWSMEHSMDWPNLLNDDKYSSWNVGRLHNWRYQALSFSAVCGSCTTASHRARISHIFSLSESYMRACVRACARARERESASVRARKHACAHERVHASMRERERA